MASNKEIVKVLKVETKGSDVSVKSLRQEISALRDVLLNTEKGTEEYNQAVQQIKANQDMLSQAMNATKTEAEALDGSYNALTQKLNELKQAWKATNDEVERSKLTEEINEVKNALKDLDTSIGNYQTNVDNYANSFKEAMTDAQESIEPAKAKFESVQKISSGLASGFAAVQGVTALLGVENDKLGQTFLKLQSAMAIAQGIGGLGDLVEGMSKAKVAFSGAITSIKSFITSLRGMKLALVSTGIGAAVVLVGLLANAYLKLADATDKAKLAKERLDKLETDAELDNKRKKVELTEAETKAYDKYVAAVKNANGDKTKLEQAELQLKKDLREASDEYYKKEIDNLKTVRNELAKNVKAEEYRLNFNKRTRENFDKNQSKGYWGGITNPVNEFFRSSVGNMFANKLYSKEEIKEQEDALNESKNKLIATDQAIADAQRAIQDNKVETARETSDKIVETSENLNNKLKANAEKAKEFAKTTLSNYASNVDVSLANIKRNQEYFLKELDKRTDLSAKVKAVEKKKVEDSYNGIGKGELNVVETALRNGYKNELALLETKQAEELKLITENKKALKEIEDEYGVDILSILKQQHQAEKDVLSLQYDEKLQNYKDYLKNRQETEINSRLGVLGENLYNLEVETDKKLYENDSDSAKKQGANVDSKTNKWFVLEQKKYWGEFDTKPEEIEKERIEDENAILEEEHNKKVGYLNEEISLMEARFGAEAKNTEAYKDLVRQKEEADEDYKKSKESNDKKLSALEDEMDKKNLARKRFTAKAAIDIASSTFGSMASILGEESKAGKAFATAQATIDTFKAANSAYAAMAGIPIVGPALGIAAALAAVTAGIANVKKIWEVPEDGEQTTMPTPASSSSVVRPNINLADTLPTQLTQNFMTDSELSELNNPTKVYVTETDISETMNKVQVTETNASF